MDMKRYLALCLLCVVDLAYAEPSQPLIWYNGDVPIKIHAHPGSCASAQPRQGMPEFSRKEGFYLYRTKPGSDCLPVYSSAPDLNKSALYVQDSGVIVQFKPNQTAERIQRWLTQHGMEGEPLALPASFLIKKYQGRAVNGIEAIQLAEWMRDSKDIGVVFAQPNWRERAATRL
ncbi:exported hypothetical protein [Candidatus Glomeribacter gigasporarum BEG34]|uniref:Uncharacterized protein n=1 Tax=Candidatus Glomeribacter gigasporarum BEG34 TaxID=1070319 RepID=G2JB52_9BURK|nr:hypothetical protein [Candidatus Glomeribacter gigasporarum]CCD30004.1 exported hypothetical protein [Candidatus Glomeribacter gigasporarum BEG34]